MEETQTVDINDINRELYDLKNKYERLKEGHRKLLIVNQNLEEKLLQNINKYETEKISLVHTISALNLEREELQRINKKLVTENERFKVDISVAIQLLHCKPSSFSDCKLESLPQEFQDKAKFHMQQESLPRYRPEKKGKVIRVPISAFPSTTVIYSIPDDDDDDVDLSADMTVPAETMAKVLNERQRELHEQTPHGSGFPSQHCSNGMHTSHSMPFLDGLQYVDHGTQTYPNFIGEREKTVNTCIFCQGTLTTNRSCGAIKSQASLPLEDPKVFLHTESEISPLTTQRSSVNTSRKNAANTHRRKIQSNNNSVSPSYSRSSMETDI